MPAPFSLKILENGNSDEDNAHWNLTAEAIFFLDKEYFPTPWTREAWSGLFETENNGPLFLLYKSEEIKGFCLFNTVAADSFSHLLKILVHPSERKHGAGTELLVEACLYLKQKGVENLFLEVEENNLTARKLYLNHGFKVIHRKKDFYGKNRTALIMTKTNEVCCLQIPKILL